jgi:hypothetical protein
VLRCCTAHRPVCTSHSSREGQFGPLCSFVLLVYKWPALWHVQQCRQALAGLDQAWWSTCCLLLLVSCSAYFSTLKIEAIYCADTSGCLPSTRRYNPQDRNLHNIMSVAITLRLLVKIRDSRWCVTLKEKFDNWNISILLFLCANSRRLNQNKYWRVHAIKVTLTLHLNSDQP